jgi:hypothetical protein
MTDTLLFAEILTNAIRSYPTTTQFASSPSPRGMRVPYHVGVVVKAVLEGVFQYAYYHGSGVKSVEAGLDDAKTQLTMKVVIHNLGGAVPIFGDPGSNFDTLREQVQQANGSLEATTVEYETTVSLTVPL